MAGINVSRLVEGLSVPRSLVYQLRTEERDVAGLLPEARRALREINTNLPISEVATLQELVDRSLAPTTFTLDVLLLCATVALILGLVGVYAVMSYIVVQRRREIGVRMAFGADARDVLTMILRQGLGLAAAGLVLGLVAALAATRLMGTLLFGVEPSDPLTFLVVAALLCLMVLVAGLLPAKRASKTDPVEALHGE